MRACISRDRGGRVCCNEDKSKQRLQRGSHIPGTAKKLSSVTVLPRETCSWPAGECRAITSIARDALTSIVLINTKADRVKPLADRAGLC